MRRLWRRILCNLLWHHDPAGPMEGASFEITPGHWHPIYECRYCHRAMFFKPQGGWAVLA